MATSNISTVLILLFLSFSIAFSEKCHPNDKKALLKIKKQLNNAYDFVSWDAKIDCCEWNNVICDEKTNRITTISIRNTNLNLPLPDTIGDLPYLETLGFYNTNLTGGIPQAIAKLSKLKSIDLRHNHLTGPVPSFLSQLKNLDYIGLSYNNFTGSIPGSLSKLSKLSGLLLDRNKLTGTLPESFSQFKIKEFYLYLSHNQLTGSIPKTWANTNFNYVDISWNKLSGDISPLFGKNKSIDSLSLSRNMLQFDFSKYVIPGKLGHLDLSHNMIMGSLPKGFAEVDVNLDVSYNRLCGKIPASLQDLDASNFMHNKCLCGAPLPAACK